MKKLLIVEDDKNWADILGKFSMDVGAEYRVAVSGGQAIDIIDDWQPDALILDMLLAGETAIALLNELRSLNKTSMRPNEARAIFREVLNDGAE